MKDLRMVKYGYLINNKAIKAKADSDVEFGITGY